MRSGLSGAVVASGEGGGGFADMEKDAWGTAAEDLRIGELSLRSADNNPTFSGAPQAFRPMFPGGSTQRRCRSLVSLCVGNLGRHLEEIVDDVHLFAPVCPAPIKSSLLAIARRRQLLSDQLLVALADEGWELLDVSDSDVTDWSIQRVAQVCTHLRAVDISRCSRLTPRAVHSLVEHCPDIHTIRWGGSFMSNLTARLALGYILPRLNISEEAGESWEELDTKSVGKGVQALRWLVWPSIDSKSSECLRVESPRVVVNPSPQTKTVQFRSVPWEARPATVLDERHLEDIDPETWAVRSTVRSTISRVPSQGAPDDSSSLLPIAERFKLAFISRNERLAPKRAKNWRQNQRRSEKAWLQSDTEAKSRAWAGMARKTLKGLNG